jgi:adenylate cyclase
MPGRINVSETVAGHVRTLFELDPRFHCGQTRTFFLNRLKPKFSRDPEGRIPNEHFVAECNRLLAGFSG